jgi:hypothetical protein
MVTAFGPVEALASEARAFRLPIGEREAQLFKPGSAGFGHLILFRYAGADEVAFPKRVGDFDGEAACRCE